MGLLLPYAYNGDGVLIHIDEAQKGQKYTCPNPNCGAELLLKIGKIPEGQKYHRRNHFAHKGKSDFHCAETILHKQFKKMCAELIRDRINSKQGLFFEWKCKECQKVYKANLLSDIKDVIVEYNLGVCKPDLALINGAGLVVLVIEVVVFHKPEASVIQYYAEKGIECLQIKLDSYEDCDEIQEVFSNEVKIKLYPQRICEQCKNIVVVNEKEEDSQPEYQSFDNDKDRFIHLLRTTGNKICPRCGELLTIKEKEWTGEPFLKCKSPKCEYT
ncbi:MAG: hypothetical protein IJW80_04230, partial [Alistipes sp.]|nr:hypothetical protein [Alistipes sp.]